MEESLKLKLLSIEQEEGMEGEAINEYASRKNLQEIVLGEVNYKDDNTTR
jgi:hypothetical protein